MLQRQACLATLSRASGVKAALFSNPGSFSRSFLAVLAGPCTVLSMAPSVTLIAPHMVQHGVQLQ